MARKTYLLTVCGVIEMVLFSGVIFGWANMVLILKSEGYFSDLCASVNSTIAQSADDKPDGGCTGQDERLTLAFTVAVFSFNAAAFAAGVLFDRYGTRVTRFTACFFFFLTGLFALFMEKEKPNLVFGMIVSLSTAGMLIAVSLFQIASIHPKHILAVSSSLSGALDSSSVVFLIFKVCYDSGASLRVILMTYSGVAIVYVVINTFVFLPKTSFVLEAKNEQEKDKCNKNMEIGTMNAAASVDNLQDKNEDEQEKDKCSKNMETGTMNAAASVGNLQKEKDPEKPSPKEEATNRSGKSAKDVEYSNGWRYMLTSRYLWLLYYLSFVQLRLWFFVGTLNTFLAFRTDNDKDTIDKYTGSFGITQFFGFVFAPFTGIVMDLKLKNVSNPYFGPILSFLTTNILCVLLGVLVLIPVLEVQYFSFVVQVMMRAFLYASLISFILKAFPNNHYGKLYGVSTMAGAIVSLLQYPAFIILDGPFNGDPFWVNLGFLTLSFTGFGFPLYLWLSYKEERELTTRL